MRHRIQWWGRWLALAILLGVAGLPALRAQTFSPGQVAGLQVGLDRRGFSPGAIDGRYGGQTRAAWHAWQLAEGRAPTDQPTLAELAELTPVEGWASRYVVLADDVAALGAAPTDWLERARVARMAHETMLELVAEKFHCREEFLVALNPQIGDWAAVGEGTELVVPFVAMAPPLPRAARLLIHLTEKHLRAVDHAGRLLAHFPCSIAAAREKRPVGELTVQTVAPHPNYTYDPANFPELDEIQRGYGKLIVPPGPNNPVGVVWIGLNLPGYGIHGTPHPERIGRAESKGCFRLANWNAARLLGMVECGLPVEVVGE